MSHQLLVFSCKYDAGPWAGWRLGPGRDQNITGPSYQCPQTVPTLHLATYCMLKMRCDWCRETRVHSGVLGWGTLDTGA